MKLDWLTFWICALATYRITVAISRDQIFSWLRQIKYIGHWAKCPFCVAPWIGAVICFGFWFYGYVEPLPLWFLLPFAFAAISIALDRTFSADYIVN